MRKGYTVRALRRNNSDINQVLQAFSYYTDTPEKLFQQIEWVEGDVQDYEDLLIHFENIETVYHLAAMVSFNKNDRQKMFDTNVEGTANIVNGCLETGIKKLCFVSSSSAIGKPSENLQADENTPWKFAKGNSAYGNSKFQSELEVWRGIEEGLNAVIVNPTIIIGPGNWDHGSSKIFPVIHKGMKYYTNGITGYVDVRDVVNCMIQLIEKDVSGERFILSEENYPYKKIFEMIANALEVKAPKRYASNTLTSIAWRLEKLRCKINGKSPLITKDIAFASHDKTEYNNKKIREKLKYNFIPIKDAIENTANCFKKDQH